LDESVTEKPIETTPKTSPEVKPETKTPVVKEGKLKTEPKPSLLSLTKE